MTEELNILRDIATRLDTAGIDYVFLPKPVGSIKAAKMRSARF